MKPKKKTPEPLDVQPPTSDQAINELLHETFASLNGAQVHQHIHALEDAARKAIAIDNDHAVSLLREAQALRRRAREAAAGVKRDAVSTWSLTRT